MTPEMMVKLRQSLVKHESYERFPYLDSVGKITIGIGFCLSDRGIDDEWINKQYLEDVTYFYNQWNSFPWFNKLNQDRQIVLIDFAFMGWKKVLGFKKMLAALEQLNFDLAAHELLNSRWAEQVKGRAVQLANGLMTGVYHV